METLTYITSLALEHPYIFIGIMPLVLVAGLVCFSGLVTLYFTLFTQPSPKELVQALARSVASTVKRSLPTALVLTWGVFAGLWLILQLNAWLKLGS